MLKILSHNACSVPCLKLEYVPLKRQTSCAGLLPYERNTVQIKLLSVELKISKNNLGVWLDSKIKYIKCLITVVRPLYKKKKESR